MKSVIQTLIDLLQPGNLLLHCLLWLDWCFYAYRISLIICLILGFIVWLLYCYLKQGWAVG